MVQFTREMTRELRVHNILDSQLPTDDTQNAQIIGGKKCLDDSPSLRNIIKAITICSDVSDVLSRFFLSGR